MGGAMSLAEYVPPGRGLPEPEARWIFCQLLFALEFCHRMVRETGRESCRCIIQLIADSPNANSELSELSNPQGVGAFSPSPCAPAFSSHYSCRPQGVAAGGVKLEGAWISLDQGRERPIVKLADFRRAVEVGAGRPGA